MDKSQKKFLLQISNIIIPIILLTILSILSIGKGDFRQIFEPTGYESLIDPINFAFAIWGPIFFFLILFLLYQARDIFKSVEKKVEMPYVFQINVFFILSTLMASLWYIFWLYRIIWVATLSMIIYLGFLLAGYLRLKINLVQWDKYEKYTLYIPWSMYTAWITAATIISITTFLESIGFNNPPLLLSNTYWAIIVLIVALIIYLAVLITRKDYVFAGVGIWVLFGILMERLLAPVIVIEVVITVIVGMIVLVSGIIYLIQKE